MQSRRQVPGYFPSWSALVLVLAAQCGGDVVPEPVEPPGGPPGATPQPGNPAPNPGATPSPTTPPGMPPGMMPPGMTPPGMTPPGTRPPPVDPPATPPPGGPGANPGSPPAGPAGPWARGIQIGLVEVAQATFIKIGEGQTESPMAMRFTPLIEGRPMVVRIHVTPGEGFTARQLRGVVALNYMGGASKQFEEAKMISGPSTTDRLQSTFNITIPAVDMKPGASLWAALYETGAAMGGDPSPLPRFPAEGATDLGVKAGRMVLDVVAVPVTGMGGPLTNTPERAKKLENDLYDVYPVQKVNLRIREPVVVPNRITERGAAFGLLRDARTADGASARPWEYYHLLVAREDTTFTFAGTAGGGGGAANDPGSRRVSLTLVRGRAIDGNTNTVAHELGHNHGLPHVPACGAGGGANLMYPLPEGQMRSNGWSLSENALKPRAMFKELMGYCRPRWISDFIYSRFEQRVRMISSMGTRPPDTTALAERSLLGYLGPGEKPNWGVVAERVVESDTAMSGQRYARLVLDDGRTVNAPVSINVMSDGLTREFGVNLPLEANTLRADVIIDGESFPVSVPTLFAP
jgi:hypothetical protein